MPLPFLKFFVSVDEKNGCRTSNNQIALNTRNLDLSPSGAVVSSDLAVLIAEVRAFTAPERAASMQRTPSTHPSWLLGVPSFEPDIAARAALSASASSHLPCPVLALI